MGFTYLLTDEVPEEQCAACDIERLRLSPILLGQIHKPAYIMIVFFTTVANLAR